MTYDIKVRTWLLIVLGVVVVLGGSYTYWNLNGNKKIAITSTSPTPTKSSVVSPTTSAKTTATPTGEQTPLSTPTPTLTPPAGWKSVEDTLSIGRNVNAGGSYKVFIKNNWQSVNGGDVMWPKALIAYGDNPSCVSTSGNGIEIDTLNNICLFHVSAGRADSLPVSTTDRYYYSVREDTDGIRYLALVFTPQISQEDKKIVLDSFTTK